MDGEQAVSGADRHDLGWLVGWWAVSAWTGAWIPVGHGSLARAFGQGRAGRQAGRQGWRLSSLKSDEIYNAVVLWEGQ